MKKLMIIALLTVSAAASSAAFAAHYEVFSTRAECKAAAKAANLAGETVSDCRLVDGGWTYDPVACQDGQCRPD
jgi:hypothetical protein